MPLIQASPRLRRYHDEVLAELREGILPFWRQQVLDPAGQGFHGAVDGQGRPVPGAPKGVILAARILWTFARAHRALGQAEDLRAAELMHRYLLEHFVDRTHGGVHWMLDAQGRPLDRTKKFYAQAFSLYALAEYAQAAADPRALEEARALFQLLERHGRDPRQGGYWDALGPDWTPIADTRLSDKDLNTPKTMNTNLHVLEAYSRLLQVAPDPALRRALADLLRVFLDRILRPDRHFGLFFEANWREVSGAVSYGHDIEGSWLLLEAAQATGQADLIAEAQTVAVAMARAVLKEGLDAEGAVLNEREADGRLHPGREWWPQAEAMVGFFNAYEISGEAAFAEASQAAWQVCRRRFRRPGGEWYSSLDEAGVPDSTQLLAGPWKCPYHNSRACLEIAERIQAPRG